MLRAERRTDLCRELGLSRSALDPDDLELLAADAPPLADDVAARIRAGARRKAGLDAAQPAGRRRPAHWLVAAAVLVLALGATLAATHPERVQAALQRLLHFIPGIGIAETDAATLVLAAPAETIVAGRRIVVTGVISSTEQTLVRFRITGLPTPSKEDAAAAAPGHGHWSTALVLPDGTRLTGPGSMYGAGSSYTGAVRFPPLPPGTTDARLEMSGLPDMPDVAVQLQLTEAATADLGPARTGYWADLQSGVRVGVLHIAFSGDRIVIDLEAAAGAPGAQVAGLDDFNPDRGLALTDDLGHTYPLVPAESSLQPHPVRPMTAVFAGPVQAGAGSLYLEVSAVQYRQPVADPLVLPVGRLRAGETLVLDRVLRAGEHEFRVVSATPVDSRGSDDDAEVRLDLDLGPERDGVRLEHVGASDRHVSDAIYTSHWQTDPATGQAVLAHITYPAGRRSLRLNLEAVFRVRGPWRIELPVH